MSARELAAMQAAHRAIDDVAEQAFAVARENQFALDHCRAELSAISAACSAALGRSVDSALMGVSDVIKIAGSDRTIVDAEPVDRASLRSGDQMPIKLSADYLATHNERRRQPSDGGGHAPMTDEVRVLRHNHEILTSEARRLTAENDLLTTENARLRDELAGVERRSTVTAVEAMRAEVETMRAALNQVLARGPGGE